MNMSPHSVFSFEAGNRRISPAIAIKSPAMNANHYTTDAVPGNIPPLHVVFLSPSTSTLSLSDNILQPVLHQKVVLNTCIFHDHSLGIALLLYQSTVK